MNDNVSARIRPLLRGVTMLSMPKNIFQPQQQIFKKSCKLVVAVQTFDRPIYLRQCLAAIAATREVQQGLPVYVFADGGPSARQEENRLVLRSASIPQSTFIARDKNLGCGQNIIDLHEHLFGREGYEQLLLIQDDVIISPHYITVLSNLWNWCSSRYDNVGMVASDFLCNMPLRQKRRLLPQVSVTNSAWASYLMSRRIWLEIKPIVLEYQHSFLDCCHYHNRPHDRIRAYFQNIIAKSEGWRGERCFPLGNSCWDPRGYFKPGNCHTGVDACMAAALFAAGKVKATLLVNRLRNIVAQATHRTRRSYLYDNVVLDVFPDDATLTEFVAPNNDSVAKTSPRKAMHFKAGIPREAKLQTRDSELAKRFMLAKKAMKSVPSYPSGKYSGRGIVMCAGGLVYFISAWVSLNMLRRSGCTLPVEVWHLGPQEMSKPMEELLTPLGVVTRDASEVCKQFPARFLSGWELKPYAIIHSQFEDVLYLDADDIPLRNPSFLFDSPAHCHTGAIFWPDRQRLPASHRAWQVFGVPYQDEPEVESGQIVISKINCWKALHLTMHYNEYSDFYFRHVYGDKETFHFAWRRLGQQYAMPPHPLTDLNNKVMIQKDFEGEPLFQHRCRPKWCLPAEKNVSIPGFHYEEECMKLLRQLSGKWPHLVTNRRDMLGPKSRSDKPRVLVAGPFIGKLGLECLNWQPAVRKRFIEGGYDRCVCYAENGRTLMYRFAEIRSMESLGETSPKNNYEAISLSTYQRITLKVKMRAIEDFGEPDVISPLNFPDEIAQYDCGESDRFVPDGRIILHRGSHKTVALCVRDAGHPIEKNWDAENWRKLASYLTHLGVQVVVLGITGDESKFRFSPQVINLLNRTSIDDCINILSQCDLAAGGSTGLLHVASRMGIPHFVWGSAEDKLLYEATNWNQVPCHVAVWGWRPPLHDVIQAFSAWHKTGEPVV